MTGTELSRTVSSARPAARVLLLTGLVVATALGGLAGCHEGVCMVEPDRADLGGRPAR